MPSPSRETKLSGAIENREIFIFPVQLTTSRIGNLIRLIHTLLSVMTIHTRTSLCCLSYACMRRDRRPKTPRLTRYTLPFCVFFLHLIISHLQSCATFFWPRNFYIFKTFFFSFFRLPQRMAKLPKHFFFLILLYNIHTTEIQAATALRTHLKYFEWVQYPS